MSSGDIGGLWAFVSLTERLLFSKMAGSLARLGRYSIRCIIVHREGIAGSEGRYS